MDHEGRLQAARRQLFHKKCQDIDPERISQLMPPEGEWDETAGAIIQRYRDTGILEPLPVPKCVNCRGTAGEPLRQRAKDGTILYQCRVAFHDVAKKVKTRNNTGRVEHIAQGVPGDVKAIGDSQGRALEAGSNPAPALPWSCDECGAPCAKSNGPEGYCTSCKPQPAPALLPCRECGELPELTRSGLCHWYRCGPCFLVPGQTSPTEPGAREEWNRRFTREANPHNLTPCECGQIPRAVAVQYQPSEPDDTWYWAVGCPAGNLSDASDTHSGAIALWNKNSIQRACGKWCDAYRIARRRYDIPTHVALGCAELPEEYQRIDGGNEPWCVGCAAHKTYPDSFPPCPCQP